MFKTCQRDATKTETWNFFLAIEKTDPSKAFGSSDGDRSADVTAIPYVQCRKCAKVLMYGKVKGGTSHPRRHASTCQSAVPSGATQISQFFKSSSVTLAMKQDITLKCADFACRDLRPFETVAGDGFVALAQALISVGVKYGQVSVRGTSSPHYCVSQNNGGGSESQAGDGDA